jgi:hypothetical protein
VGAGLVNDHDAFHPACQAPGIVQAQTILRKINPQLYKDTPAGVFVTPSTACLMSRSAS